MSVDAIGARIAEIQSKMQALLGPAAPVPAATGASEAVGTTGSASASGFDKALARKTGAPVATAASASVSAAVPVSVGSGPTPYAAEISAAAAKHGVDPALLTALIKQESGFNPNARSPAGASGLCQLMPGTAAGLGVTDPTDPAQAIEGGAKYLAQQLKAFGGDPEKALAAYNAGPGAVSKYGGVPPFAETQNYVKKVMAYAEAYRAQGIGAATGVTGTPTAANVTPTGLTTGGTPTATAAALAMAADPSLTSPVAPSTEVATSPSQFGIA
ncbi:MAG TPA: lytic transglycosylase domain-containing protein [Solirubrobacteraceae bacterium]|nr:lytic transglycosylase domain-containing protein [Solirubrobacteraceae bacterium]